VEQYPPPVIKPTLRLFFSIDVRSLSDLKIRILSAFLNQTTYSKGQLQLHSANYVSSQYEYVYIFRQTIKDAFETWKRALTDMVDFEYIPYRDKIRTPKYVNNIIIVSATNISHVNEHTTEFEKFSNQATLAHASINFLHLNSETEMFIIAPHVQRQYVKITREIAPRKYKIFSVKKNTALEYLQYDSYTKMSQQLQTLTNAWTDNLYIIESCFFCMVLHEIGHILGIGHCNLENSIMYDTIINNDQRITSTDVNAVRTLFRSLTRKEEILEYQMIESRCPKTKDKRKYQTRLLIAK
jgi:predicted Zn-dependent protease